MREKIGHYYGIVAGYKNISGDSQKKMGSRT
jgi:hypothetical protein